MRSQTNSMHPWPILSPPPPPTPPGDMEMRRSDSARWRTRG